MRRTAALIILTGCLGALPWTAFGLGLGNIQLHSALGQKLDADIDLVGADQQAVSGLRVTLATPDQFKQAGADDGQPILHALKFKVIETNGSWHVHVTSADPVREPFITFLVDAQWPSGQVVREYTLLIDPLNYAGAPAPAATAPAATASAAAPAARGTTLQTRPTPTATPQPAAPAIAASTTPVSRGDNYGPIRRGATLWGIAQRLRAGTDIGIDQMMIALYRANPDAFGGNINRMKAGYVLRVPDAAAIRDLDRHEAITAVRDANRRYLAANAKPAAPTAATTAPPAETARLQLVAPAADDAKSDATPGADAGAAAAAVDQLKQQLAQAQQKADNAAAANAKLSGQVDNLNKQLADTKRLLTVKDQQLSQLQAKVRGQTAGNENAPSASLVDRAIALVMTPLFLVGLLAVIVLIVGGGFVWRQRRAKAAQAAAGSVVVSTEAAPVEADDEEAAPEDVTAPEEAEVFAAAAATDAADDVLPAYEEPTGETSIDELLDDSHEAADPIAEADFHIDYGLYDQAAEIIRKAIEADPARDELILKLFRIYAAAADAPSYASAAQEFADWGAEHPAEWDEICAKGRELVPGEPLFAAGYLDAGVTTMHAETTASTEIGLDTATDIAGTDTAADALGDDAAAPADPRDVALDFDLSGLSLDGDAPAAAEPAPSAAVSAASEPEPAAAEDGIEFDLSPEAMGRSELPGGDRLVDTQTEFEDAIKELSEFVDTNLPAAAAPETDADEPGVATTPAGVDPDADDGEDFGGGFGADELDTKLDLARAYIDMGDPEGARAILQEVLEEGGAQHKEQAQSLLARVG